MLFFSLLHVPIYFVIECCKETEPVYMIYGLIQEVSETGISTLCGQCFAVILTKIVQIAAVGTNLVANLCTSVVVYTGTGRCLHHM